MHRGNIIDDKIECTKNRLSNSENYWQRIIWQSVPCSAYIHWINTGNESCEKGAIDQDRLSCWYKGGKRNSWEIWPSIYYGTSVRILRLGEAIFNNGICQRWRTFLSPQVNERLWRRESKILCSWDSVGLRVSSWVRSHL